MLKIAQAVHQGESSGLSQKAWNSWTHHIEHCGARKDQGSTTMGTWQIESVIILILEKTWLHFETTDC